MSIYKFVKFRWDWSDDEPFKGGCSLSNFAVPKEDSHSKDFIMAMIRNILTDDEGNFKLKSFTLSVESGTNCASDLVSMRKITENKLKRVLWSENLK